MDQDLLGLAFAAGLVAALNPCGFAMLPAYLALVVRSEDTSRRAAMARAVTATAAMALGFIAVFTGFGLLTVSVASTVQRYLPYVTTVIGVGLVALGVWLLAGREITPLRPLARGARRAPTARLGSMFGYGVGYAIASVSCTVGPFLAVTAAGLRSGSAVGAVAVYLAYAGGFTLVVGVLAVAAAVTASTVTARIRRIMPYVNRISGALLVVVGGYVGYYGFYEIRLFGGNGNAEDPVIGAAGRVQGAIASWVHQHGAWPWLAALMVVVVVGAASVRARYRRADRATAGDES